MKISIFIPTYNSGEILRETLDSVLGQTYKDIEVLAVDDSSTDGITQQILHEYEAKDSRLRVFVKPNEGDVPHSWNFVFPYLKGEFTFYMSHDDLLEPEAIEKMVHVAESDEEIDCVVVKKHFFVSDLYNPEEKYREFNDKFDAMVNNRPISGEKAFDLTLDYTLNGFSIWRTDLIRREGMPTFCFNCDDLMHKLWRLKCRKVAYSDALFGYRQAEGAITAVYGIKQFRGLEIYAQMAMIVEKSEFLDESRKDYMIYYWYKMLRQYQAWFVRHKKDFTVEQTIEIRGILKDCHKRIGGKVKYRRSGIYGFIINRSAHCYPLFRLMARFDKINTFR